MMSDRRERLLFVLTLLWSAEHFASHLILSRYGIGISLLAPIIALASVLGLAYRSLSKFSLYAITPLLFVGLLGPAQSTMTLALLLAVILSLVSFRRPPPWAGAYLASAIYFFAGLNKLVSEVWWDGMYVEQYLPQFIDATGLTLAVVIGTIVVEFVLALSLSLRLRASLALLAAFHLGIVVLVSTDLLHAFALAIYGAIMLYLSYEASMLKIKDLHRFLRGRS